jgi:hypothetical protein
MSRIFVLEGPDGSGKTTLAKELQANGFQYLKCGVPTPEQQCDLLRYYGGILLNCLVAGDWVIDRLFVGELVYGPVMRGASSLEPEEEGVLIDLCQRFNIQHVFCMPPLETVVLNWNSRRAEEYVDQEKKLHEIYAGYRRQIADFPPKFKMVYDYTRRQADVKDCPLLSPWPAYRDGGFRLCV